MKNILLLMILVMQQVHCGILSTRRYFDQEDCDNFGKIEEIEAGIKYLSLLKYMEKNLYEDLIYISQIRKDDIQLRKQFQIPLENFEKELIKYKAIFQSHSQNKLTNNSDYYDTNLQKAYEQFQEINFFENIYQDTLKFFNFEIVMEKKFNKQEIERISEKVDPYDEIESTLKRLLKNFQFCQGYEYDVGLLQIDSQKLPKDKYLQSSNPGIEPNQINILQFMNNDVYNLKNFEQQVKEDDCPKKYPLIQGLIFEFEKLIELYHFKSVYEERKQAFNGFFEKIELFLTDTDQMTVKIMQVQLNESIISKYEIVESIIENKHVHRVVSSEDVEFQSLDSILKDYYHCYSDIMKYYELLNHTKQFISLSERKFDKLQNSLQFMTQYFDGFNYEIDYLKKGLEFFERDTKICNQQQCKQKVAYMEKNIQKYHQANELNKFIRLREHYDSIFSEIIKNNQIIIPIIQDLEKFQQLFKLNEKLYYVQVYPTHKDPEDLESVKAYENLIILQNKLVFLLNSFTKADELLDLDFNSNSANYKNLKDHLLNRAYDKNYSERQVRHHFNDLFDNQIECSFPQTQSKIRNSNQQFPKDDSHRDNYYWFARNLKPHHVENLLILPENVDEFEIEDIPNHQILSKQCKADIKGLVEDIIETSKIIELLNYNLRGRNQFDKLISSALQIKVDFLKKTKDLYFEMVKLNLQKKIRYFKPLKNQTKDKQLQDLFNQLHSINDNLGYIELAFQQSRDLLTFNEYDFNELQQYQGLVNQYFEHQPKMQLKDKEKELQDLFQEYKSCTGREFLQDFCQQYEEQNIYGGICHQSCYDKQNKVNVLQFDVSMDKQKPLKQTKKLKGQKKKIQSMKSKQKRQ